MSNRNPHHVERDFQGQGIKHPAPVPAPDFQGQGNRIPAPVAAPDFQGQGRRVPVPVPAPILGSDHGA